MIKCITQSANLFYFKKLYPKMQFTEKDQLFMGLAIELAHTAYDNDEVPVGAVIVQR